MSKSHLSMIRRNFLYIVWHSPNIPYNFRHRSRRCRMRLLLSRYRMYMSLYSFHCTAFHLPCILCNFRRCNHIRIQNLPVSKHHCCMSRSHCHYSVGSGNSDIRRIYIPPHDSHRCKQHRIFSKGYLHMKRYSHRYNMMHPSPCI